MVKRGYAPANVRDALEIDVGEAKARLLAHVEQDIAPGIDDERMAERVAAVLVVTDLRCGDDKKTRLDRSRAQQNVPVRLARGNGEGAGTAITSAAASAISRKGRGSEDRSRW